MPNLLNLTHTTFPEGNGEHPQAHLKHFRGVIHAYGYAGFTACRRLSWMRDSAPQTRRSNRTPVAATFDSVEHGASPSTPSGRECARPSFQVLKCIWMIQCGAPFLCLPVGLQPTDVFRGEGRDPAPPWAPAGACPLAARRVNPWAGVRGFLMRHSSAVAKRIYRMCLNTSRRHSLARENSWI